MSIYFFIRHIFIWIISSLATANKNSSYMTTTSNQSLFGIVMGNHGCSSHSSGFLSDSRQTHGSHYFLQYQGIHQQSKAWICVLEEEVSKHTRSRRGRRRGSCASLNDILRSHDFVPFGYGENFWSNCCVDIGVGIGCYYECGWAR